MLKSEQIIKHQQILKELGESAQEMAEQAMRSQQLLRELGSGISSKADQAIAGQKELEKKADQTITGQQGLGKKLDRVIAVQQESVKNTELAIEGQQELKAKIEQAIAGQKELEKKLDLALDGFEEVKADLRKIMQSVQQVNLVCADGMRYSSEAVWGELFNQVSDGSHWLKDRGFAAGRWAVGYQYLYAGYRILNEVHPKNILELGLGQSTKLISQYAAANPEVHHQVVEHDPEWIDFFRKNYNLPANTKMVRLERDFTAYKEAEHVRVYKNFSETFKGQKFDFISIDAPLGGDMKQYARIDVLKMLPDCLAENFIIIIDDAERIGETNTIKEMTESLKAHLVPFAIGRYSGKKDCAVICSKDLKFVCSM